VPSDYGSTHGTVDLEFDICGAQWLWFTIWGNSHNSISVIPSDDGSPHGAIVLEFDICGAHWLWFTTWGSRLNSISV